MDQGDRLSSPGRRVLDLGVGTGKLTAGLLATGAEVVAVEPDPEMLVELRGALALDGIRAYLASRPETADGGFTLPMLTCVLRLRSSGQARYAPEDAAKVVSVRADFRQ